MPIVSISEAARLTGKSRRTLHRHIDAGHISRSHTQSGEKGIDISELIRVYGKLKTQPVISGQTEPRLQRATDSDTKCPTGAHHDIRQNDTEPRRIHDLEKEVENLNRLLSSKQETIDSLKTALKLLEYHQEKTEAIAPKETQTASEPPQNTPTAPIEPPTPPTGFWSGFKKLFR